MISQRHVPSGRVSLIFNLSARIREQKAGETEWREYDSFISGLHDTPTVTESAGANVGVQINFTALGARLFLGLPLHALTNLSVPAADVVSNSRDLSSQLFDATTWAECFDLLDRVIAQRLAGASPLKRELAWAWRTLTSTSGRARIARIVAELGWSERHFASSFRTEFGLAPKTFAQVLRFNRAVVEGSRDRHSLADLAIACGYYDQAHFNRDFTRFAGVAPLILFESRSSSDPGFHVK